MADRRTAFAARHGICHPCPRSALRTTKTAQELHGMRSLRRWDLSQWERLAEAQRIAVARARRLFPRAPRDKQRRGDQ
jgi:hypothetical protein